MKLLKNRWLLLILGLLVGGYVGGELALRYSASKKVDYDQALEDHYIDSRIWTLATSIVTLAKAEKGKIDGITGDHQLMLRSAFLALVDLHKTGHYEREDEEIRKHLKKAKAFMAERPEEFLNQKFFAASYIANHGNNPKMSDDPESAKVTNLERKRLQEAFDYVDELLPPSEKGDREQDGAGQPPTPLESK
jgi:hypothetical protein